MQAEPLDSRNLTISGRTPALDSHGMLTGIEGNSVKNSVSVPSRAIAFIAVPAAGNSACN
jgi:heparanase